MANEFLEDIHFIKVKTNIGIANELRTEKTKVESRMKWLHISDIHYDQINDGIQTLLLRDDFERYIRKHKIKVDEVFFTGDFRHAKKQSEQDIDEVAKNAVDFLQYIAICVGVTDNDHIHIVPGNHDLDCGNIDDVNSEDARKLAESIKNYNGNFVGSSNDYLKSRFSFFEKCAVLLNNQIWVDFKNGLIHRGYHYTNYSIVYINSAIACGQKGERGKLVIGTVDLHKVLSEIKKKNDGKPLIFLAHHPMEVFSINEITVIKDLINKLEIPALWLCGDFHDMLENNTYELAQITTGCFKKEPTVEAGFYVGEISPQKGVRFHAYLGTKRGRWEYSESYSELSNAALPKSLRWNDEDEYPNDYISAEHFAEQGDYAKAIEWCNNALAKKGLDIIVVSKMKLSLGYWHIWQDENLKGIEILVPLLDLFRKNKDDRNLALCYNYIGLAYEEMKEWPRAEYNYIQAKEIYTKNINIYTSRPLRIEINQCYANMGLMYFRWGQSSPSDDYFGNAKLYFEKALLFFEESENDSECRSKAAIFFNNYALFCDMQNNYVLAINYYKKALVIKSQTLGQWHRSTARIYANIALAYGNLDDIYNAYKNCETAKRIYIENGESQSRDALRNLGTFSALKIKEKKYDEALMLMDELLTIRIERFGENDTDVAQTLHNIGKVYLELHENEIARDFFGKAHKIRDDKIPTHRYTVDTIILIAKTYIEEDSNVNQLMWLNRALDIQKSTLGYDHPDTILTLRMMEEARNNS